MRYFSLIFFIVTILLSSCQLDKQKPDKQKKVEERKNLKPFPKILDTIGIGKFLHFDENTNYTWLTTSDYNFFFIGKVRDTIFSYPITKLFLPPEIKKSKSQTKYENLFKKYYVDWEDNREYKYCEQTEVEIQVDTTSISTDFYPTLLINKDKDTILIGSGNHIRIIMEAIDTTGNWKPIQKRFIYMCGVGISSVVLPPNECVLTFAPIFKGNYKTQLRLRLGENYSNTFYGSINYRQFQDIFDDNGNYKKEYEQEMESNKTTK